MSEFPDRPRERDDLGRPEDDGPGVMRIQRADREARYDPATPRALRLPDRPYGWPWVLISGPDAGCLLDHDDVREWPVTHWLSGYTVAMAKLEQKLGHPKPSSSGGELAGDMDVAAFRG